MIRATRLGFCFTDMGFAVEDGRSSGKRLDFSYKLANMGIPTRKRN